MKYKPNIVSAAFRALKIPAPEFEYRFDPVRRWRFDLAWPEYKLYAECDGGIWIHGGHNRGAQMKKDWAKRNAATIAGWRGLWVEPKDLLSTEFMETIKKALGTKHRLL